MVVEEDVNLQEELRSLAGTCNTALYQKDLQTILVHVRYAANSGKYVWCENCQGWDRDSKIEYVIMELRKLRLNCRHMSNDTIEIRWGTDY